MSVEGRPRRRRKKNGLCRQIGFFCPPPALLLQPCVHACSQASVYARPSVIVRTQVCVCALVWCWSGQRQPSSSSSSRLCDCEVPGSILKQTSWLTGCMFSSVPSTVPAPPPSYRTERRLCCGITALTRQELYLKKMRLCYARRERGSDRPWGSHLVDGGFGLFLGGIHLCPASLCLMTVWLSWIETEYWDSTQSSFEYLSSGVAHLLSAPFFSSLSFLLFLPALVRVNILTLKCPAAWTVVM